MTLNDKRTSPRFKGAAGSHIVYLEGAGTIRDFSLNGMFVMDPEPLPEGSKINFRLRAGTVDIQLQGIVIRSEPHLGMAIQFTDLTRESIRRLKIYISELGSPAGVPKKP